MYLKLRRHFSKSKAVLSVIERFASRSGRTSGRISEIVQLVGDVDPVSAGAAGDLLYDFRLKLILNKVRSKRQVVQVQCFVDLVQDYLSTVVEYVGFVRSDAKFIDACERRGPLLIDSPKAAASRDLCELVMSGLDVPDKLHRFTASQSRKLADLAKVSSKSW